MLLVGDRFLNNRRCTTQPGLCAGGRRLPRARDRTLLALGLCQNWLLLKGAAGLAGTTACYCSKGAALEQDAAGFEIRRR